MPAEVKLRTGLRKGEGASCFSNTALKTQLRGRCHHLAVFRCLPELILPSRNHFPIFLLEHSFLSKSCLWYSTCLKAPLMHYLLLTHFSVCLLSQSTWHGTAGGTKEPEVPDTQFCLARGRKWDVSQLSPLGPDRTPMKLTVALG